MSAKASLKGRSLLTLSDLSDPEFFHILELAAQLKRKKRSGVRGRLLDGKNIALIFEKSSTRTRCAFVVAASDEGATAEYLGVHDIHFGKKENVDDTARVLGRFFDGIAFRGFKQETVEKLARYSGVPVWNALTDDWHPTQVFADLMTVKERFGRLEGLKFAYVGDGRNNVVNSLMFGCSRCGMQFVNCTPRELAPPAELVERARAQAASGGTVNVIHEPKKAVEGAHVLYTDVWVSMGEEDKFQERLRLLRPYQIDSKLMEATGRAKSGDLLFLHCLPAYHDDQTEITATCGALEVSDEVFEGPFSGVFDQAENRMHTIKAIMIATLTAGE
ncbi:MAG: ornithine carbamoyltransferase [Kiritimatiellia bacterium]